MITLFRYRFTEQYTLGVLAGFFTLELPWRDNKSNISCIPYGVYPISFIKQSANKKFYDCYRVFDVLSRAGVLIHNGNLVEHTHGCILIGENIVMLKGMPFLTNSKNSLRKFVSNLHYKNEELKII
jgi:hypothetical protein